MGTPRWLAAALILAWMAPQVEARQAGSPAQAPAPYGPVLYVNGKPVTGPAQRDPAEVHDEADSGANPAAQPGAPPSRGARQDQQDQQQQQRQKQQAARRHPAWQAQNEAMAPRPLHGDPAPAAQHLTIPAPAAA